MAKLLVMNVNHATGTSKKTGKNFDFTTLMAFKNKPEVSSDFVGIKPMEFFCDKKIIPSVPELPAVCDVEYELEPGFNGQAKMTVTGIKLIKKIDLGF